MLSLLIDTTSENVKIGLAKDDQIFVSDIWFARQELAENLTGRIQKLLQENSFYLQDVKKILVHSGPGGFSTLRIGVTEANILGFGLGIPVWGIEGNFSELSQLLGKEKGDNNSIVIPKYSRPPKIGERKN